MAIDYEKDTRSAYQDDRIAQVYHAAFASERGLRSVRFRAVAHRETSVVRSLLGRIKHGRVVDIPAGTGKLAGMFAQLGSSVIACDIAENMLAIARRVYTALGYRNVEFLTCDAAKMSESIRGEIDAVVCLRLMHRVPPQVRQAILFEITRVTDHAIISYGVESGFHRLRRRLRNLVFGGGTSALSYETATAVRHELERKFEILATRAVIPILSQERIYLLRVRMPGE